LIDIGVDRGRQQAGDGGGSGSATEKQRCNKKRTTTTDAVPSENKIVTVEPVGSSNKSVTATYSKNLQGTAQLPPEPPSGRRGEDSVDSDNVSSSVSLQPQRAGKHSGTCAVVYMTYRYNFHHYLHGIVNIQFFNYHKVLFTVVFISARP
jgi:hypothetical protein